MTPNIRLIVTRFILPLFTHNTQAHREMWDVSRRYLRYAFLCSGVLFFLAINFFLICLSINVATKTIGIAYATIVPCGMLKKSVPIPITGRKIKITIAAFHKSYFVTSRDNRSSSGGGGRSSILFDFIVLFAFHFNTTIIRPTWYLLPKVYHSTGEIARQYRCKLSSYEFTIWRLPIASKNQLDLLWLFCYSRYFCRLFDNFAHLESQSNIQCQRSANIAAAAADILLFWCAAPGTTFSFQLKAH
jgi:hypothetical protein